MFERVRPGRGQTSNPARAESGVHEAAFEAAFLKYYARIYGLLFRLVGNRAEAEDLTLEAFWRLWQRGPHVDETAESNAAGGWLYRVATNLGYNALRAARRRARREDAAARTVADAGAGDPQHEAERAEARRRVHDILRQMRARDAQILLLRHSGLSYKEIAAVVGVSPGSIGTLLARAEKEFERLYHASD